MADFAEGYTDDNDVPFPSPPELTLAWQVERWGTAAIFEAAQPPAGLLIRMTVCANVYQAVISYLRGSHRLADWARNNPEQLRIITRIREMRLKRND